MVSASNQNAGLPVNIDQTGLNNNRIENMFKVFGKFDKKSMKNDKQEYQQYWEFSTFSLQNCYMRCLQYLNNKYLKLENAENKEIVKQLRKKFGKELWQIIYQSFKFLVQKKFNFVFVQENEKHKIAHVSFMHQKIINSFKPRDGEAISRSDGQNYQLKKARKYTYITRQKNSTISINLITGEIVSQFQKAPIIFGYQERQQFLSVLIQSIKDSKNNIKNMEFISQPLGLQIQAKYIKNEWFLSSKSSIRVNELRCHSDITLYETFVNLLQKYNILIDTLNKNFSSNYTPLPVQDNLYLVSIFDTQSNQCAKCDVLFTTAIQKLQTTNLELNGKLYEQKQQINDLINTRLSQYSMLDPIFSITVKIDNQVYEIQSEVAIAFYSLIDKLNTYKTQEITNQQFKEIIHNQLQDLIQQSPNNQYLQFISNKQNQQNDDAILKIIIDFM